MENTEKIQKNLGAVHLAIAGLDLAKFKALIEKHSLALGGFEQLFMSGYCYVENWLTPSGYKWIKTNIPDQRSRLIDIHILEDMLPRSVEGASSKIKGFIEVTTERDGVRQLLNVSQIESVTDDASRAAIVLVGDCTSVVYVLETYKEVLNLLREAQDGD